MNLEHWRGWWRGEGEDSMLRFILIDITCGKCIYYMKKIIL